MRIGQATHVEHHVGIHRYAMFEAEGFEHQGEIGIAQFEEILDPGTQLVGGKIAGIHQMAVGRDALQHFAFGADAFFQRAVAGGQGMPAAGFGKARHQRGILGGEKQHAQVVTLPQRSRSFGKPGMLAPLRASMLIAASVTPDMRR
jgi:hypothetical protein